MIHSIDRSRETRILIAFSFILLCCLLGFSSRIFAAETKVSPGTSKESATQLQYSDTGYYTTRSSNDADWFSFQTTKTGYTDVYFKNTSMESRASCELYSSIDERLDYNSYVYQNSSCSLNVKLEANQTYYIKISNGSTGGTYILDLDFTDDVDGNTVEDATSITVNKSYTSSLDGYQDEDYFVFTAPKSGKNNFQFKNTGINGFMKVEIHNYDTNERLWYDSYLYINGTSSVTLELVEGQKYYIYIGGAGSNYGVYSLQISNQTVSSIKLSKTSLTFSSYGKSVKLTATVSPALSYDTSVTWSISNSSVAGITSDGTVTPYKPGVVTVTCTANDGNGASATCKIVVKPSKVSYCSIKNLSCASNKVALSWSSVTGATGYTVYCYDTSKKKWNAVKTVASSKNQATITKVIQKGKSVSLSAGTTYKFRVAAYVTAKGTKYYGANSSTVTASTCPGKINFKTVKKVSSTEVKFSWSKASGASGYYIYKKNSYSGSYYVYKTISSGSKTSCNLYSYLGNSGTYKVAAYRVVNGVTYVGALSSAKTVK